MTLEELRQHYAEARVDALSAAPLAAAGPNRCRYCGKWWRRWAGSKLDGHAQCVVSDDFKALAREVFYSHPKMTGQAMADALGVTTSVVRAWCAPLRGCR